MSENVRITVEGFGTKSSIDIAVSDAVFQAYDPAGVMTIEILAGLLATATEWFNSQHERFPAPGPHSHRIGRMVSENRDNPMVRKVAFLVVGDWLLKKSHDLRREWEKAQAEEIDSAVWIYAQAVAYENLGFELITKAG